MGLRNGREKNKEPLLVSLWMGVLTFLEKVSLFYVVRTYILTPKYRKGNYRFVDYWILAHTLLSFIYVFVANMDSVPNWIKYGIAIYGTIRVFEIFIYQLNVMFVHPYVNKNYSLNSYRRMTIALLHNFIEIVFWFAGTYSTLHFISNINPSTAIYESFTQMVTYSLSIEESKWSFLTLSILLLQSIVGVFMTILSLARFVSLFPQPGSQDVLEQEANDQRFNKILDELSEIKDRLEMQENNSQLNREIDNQSEIIHGR